MGLYDDRKKGVGITAFSAHSGDVANFYGEKSFAQMKTILEAESSLLTFTNGGITWENEPELHEDEIDTELYPVQTAVIGNKDQFKLNLPTGDEALLAVIAGQSASTSYDAGASPSGVAAKGIGLGVSVPPLWSLLHRVRQSADPSKFDWLYIPRVQVNPKVILKFMKKEIRAQDVVFNCLPTKQDGTGDEIDMRIKVAGDITGMGMTSYHLIED